jgi:myosin X
VHPAQQEQLLAADSGALGTLKKAGTMLKGTLKGFGLNTLKRLTGGTVKKSTTVSDAELAKIKGKIVDEWKRLRGLDKDGARRQYMEIIQSWDGYGSNLFEVEQTTNKAWPKELWLAISLNGVGIYVRGERKRLGFYKYETVLSFGAPVANKYKIMVDNVGSMLFDTTMVLEIAKLMKEYIKEIVTRRR